MTAEADPDPEDSIGVAFSSFITAVIVSVSLYGLMLVLLTLAHNARRAEEIAIRNDDDARDVRYKRRKREGLPDDFFLKFGYSYDWVFVFKVRNEWDELDDYQKEFSMKRIINSLVTAGLETSQFYSVQRDEVYCKVRCPLDRLVSQADSVDYKLLLDSAAAEAEMRSGRRASAVGRQTGSANPWLWKGRVIEDQFSQSGFGVFDYLYGEYKMEPTRPGMVPTASLYPKLYKKHELENGVTSEFGSVDRIKLLQTVFEGPLSEKCCGLNLSLLKSHGCVECVMPLHNPKEKVMLEKKWLRAHQLPWKQPVWDVKAYFGEKVALYFAFVGHVNSWLMAPAVFGLLVYVNMASDGTYTVESQMFFGVFLAVWSTFLLEFWKRREKTLVMMWGMTGFEEEEADRPEFEGEEVPSPVNGEDDMFFPETERLKAMGKTTAALAGILVVVTGVFASVFALGAFLNLNGSSIGSLNDNGVFDLAQLLPYMVCAAVIMVGSRLFEKVAVSLSDLENHRTDTQYEDAVIAKTFVFEFFNSYSACFYIIFLKAYAPNDACVGGCIRELHYLMGCIFFSIIMVQCTLQVVGPIRNSAARAAEEKEGADPGKQLSAIERQFLLEEYDPMFGSFKHFKDIAIQFGYATLFSTAFPLAPALAFVSTYFEIRVDAWVLLQKSRRVVPTGAEDIGTWQSVFECLASVAVITNMGIAFVVSASEVNTTWMGRMVGFLMAEHALFFGQMLFAQLVDDVPTTTADQIERQEFMASKLIENMEDDDLDLVKEEDEEEEDDDEFVDDIYDDDEDPVL